jgi:(2Fe-2S) ferredoxin
MSKKHQQISPFTLEGRFLGFEIEDGFKIKRLNLATAEGEYCIKLAKEARASVRGVLTPGDWLTIAGEKHINLKTDEVKYKAYLIQQTSPAQGLAPSVPVPATQAKAKPQATILVCQKSDCMKRGGKAVCQALQAELRDRGLQDQVTIKMTGCMKQCKEAPNLVVMPGKTRYSRIKATDVPALLDQHFPQPTSPAPTSPELVPAH